MFLVISSAELLALRSVVGEYVRSAERIEAFIDVVSRVEVTPEQLLSTLLDPEKIIVADAYGLEAQAEEASRDSLRSKL